MSRITDSSATPACRIGVLGVFVRDPDSVPRVNRVLWEFAHLIRARLGLPQIPANPPLNVIALIFTGNPDQLGALSGRLGQIPGVEAKSVLSRDGIVTAEEGSHAT